MAGTIGRAFKISKKQAQGYGYAKPGMRPNSPGVTAIAAVNGRGSYSARSAMAGRSRAARLGHARNATRAAMTAADKAAFAKRMREARAHRKHRTNRSPGTATSPGVSATANRRKRMTRTHRTGKKTRRLRHLRKNRKASRKTTARRPRRTRRKKASRKAAPRRTRRRKKATRKAAPRRTVRRTRRRRKKSASRKPRTTRRRRKARKMSANRTKRRTTRRRRKKSTRRAAPRRTRRRRKARRHVANRGARRTRRTRKARRHTANRGARRTRRTRKHAKRHTANRHHAKRSRRHAKRHHKNGHAFRKNEGFVTTLTGALKVGLIAGAGFMGHKAATKLFADMVLDKVIGAPATPVTPPAAPAVSGLEALQPYKRILAALIVGGAGVVGVNMLVKDQETKKLVIAGIAGSFLHTLLVDALSAFGGATGGKVASYLSGYDSSSAYSLGASIMPHYAAVGEYFDSGVSGLGEYFDSGVAGLGNYGGNPDIYQAQAGFGAMADSNSMHVDPAGDLDRELTLAEAAAGVGMLPSYEAAAGLGDFVGAGRQAIGSRSTWVPGTTNPGVWAPVTAVSKPQSSTAMVPAGILQTSGGQGVFG